MDNIENTLRESESEKKAILDGCEDVIILFDKDLGVLWANKNVEKVCSSPVGKKCYDMFCGNSKRCSDCTVLESFQNAKTSKISQQTTIAGAINNDLVFRITSTPVKNISGGTEKVIVIAKDITEKLQLDKQLRHASKMEAVGTLAGGIAHDFNNILTPIMGYSEIIHLKILNNKLNPQEMTGYVDEILKAAKRAKKLVEQILTFSRSVEQKKSHQYVHPIIKEAMKLIHTTMPSSIQILQDIDENCGMVTVDPVDIHQILINLCTNASDAMAGKRGVLKVTLKRSEKHVDGGEWLELSVIDNGCGIAPEIQERIFEPYFTTKEKEQGTGMGLAMVHGIIIRQGGRVSVDSRVGEGTTVTLRLPVTQEKASLEEIINPDELIGGEEHILLIDDEEQVVSATGGMLESLGYKVTGMTSSRESLLNFYEASNIYDIVITDLIMPYMTGVELCEKMKEIRPDIPILLFTGFLEDIAKAAAIQSGISGFCIKPISMKEMAKIIRSALD